MGHQVLYRAYRPQSFKEVVGQNYIVKTLQNSIKKNNIAHAYLFSGPRGTGKTSVAKIFAKAINCTNSEDDACNECDSCISANEGTNPDIIEFDAASHSRVEEIRDILKYINFAPTTSKYKVYIIDEVHMLSTSAFNAFLKTLEEPPEHVVFILATTEPNKVLPTVLSRCQKFNFSKLKSFEIKERMTLILEKEGIAFEEKALDIISSLADGGLRDALSLLEQYLAYNPKEVTLKDVEELFSLTSVEDKIDLLKKANSGNVAQAIIKLRSMYQKGADMLRLTGELLEIVKESLIYSDSRDESLLTSIGKIEAQKVIQDIGVHNLLKELNILEETLSKNRPNQGMLSYLELALIRMSAKENNSEQVEAVVETKPVKARKEKAESGKEEAVQVTEKKEEPSKPTFETVMPEKKKADVDLDELLNILKTASKEEKINNEIVINRIELLKFDSEKRKFYTMLNGTKLFASSADVMIITASDAQVEMINDPILNKDLCQFVLDTYNTCKSIYGITASQQNELVEMYRNLTPEERKQIHEVKKFVPEVHETKEDRLKAAFKGLKVED